MRRARRPSVGSIAPASRSGHPPTPMALVADAECANLVTTLVDRGGCPEVVHQVFVVACARSDERLRSDSSNPFRSVKSVPPAVAPFFIGRFR